ncbi:MAG: aspartate aminotransferase family protein [Solirubrobacterales bacterium]|nr:aspartate aminotransferase family protein [Solirubrobacterales bacterium]
MSEIASVGTDQTNLFPRELDREYPLIARGSGVWLTDVAGNDYLDAVGGGAMTSTLGHAVPEIVEAARRQAQEISFIYNQQFTSPAQEKLAEELTSLTPPGMNRVHFTSGGAEANETALRLLRSYHVERGEPDRCRTISQAQAYHGPTMATLGLTGRPGLWHPYDPFIARQLYVPPSTWRFDPTGDAALRELDDRLAEAGPGSVAAFFCEPVSAAALPAYSPPDAFWAGLAERRDRHGFLIVLDEVVTGMGRTGAWFASEQLPFVPDIITTAKGLGAGYAPVGAVICGDHVFDAIASGSRAFEHGHTWDGAPLPCAVGVAVIDYLKQHKLVERVADRGPQLRDQLVQALEGSELVREVRGRGFLLGIEYVDPRDGESMLPSGLSTARQIDLEALNRGLIVYSTQPTADGYVGDQTLLAPAFVSSDEELDEIVQRLTATVHAVEKWVKQALSNASPAVRGPRSSAVLPA